MRFKAFILSLICLFTNMLLPFKAFAYDESPDSIMKNFVSNIFLYKSKSVLTKDLDSIKSLYDTNTKYGQWAYEYEEKKVKYIDNWAKKQGIKFTDITPNLVFRKAKISDNSCYFYVLCNTEYKYVYEDNPEVVNTSRIGTYHSINLNKKDNKWIITKEWYTDPFADSLKLEDIKIDKIIK